MTGRFGYFVVRGTCTNHPPVWLAWEGGPRPVSTGDVEQADRFVDPKPADQCRRDYESACPWSMYRWRVAVRPPTLTYP